MNHRFRAIQAAIRNPGRQLARLAREHREAAAEYLELIAPLTEDGAQLTAVARVIRHVDPDAWLQAAREAGEG